MSARDVDENGYITIENNPITRVGVFPYLGSSISPELEPDTIYYVYRPADELADPECIDSFKMLPLINDHTMLGSEEDGFTPPEKKGVEGIIGEAVALRDNILYATIKIFSRTLAALIENGKKALSLGYRCRYEYQPGVFAGQAYSFVQRSLRGNHIALVDAARCDVAVLDNRITLDHFDLNLEENKTMPTEKELSEKVAAQDAQIKALTEDNAKLKTALDESEKEKEKDAEDADEEEKKAKKAEDEKEEDDKKKSEDADEEEKKKDKDAMDAAAKKIDAMDAEIQALKKDGMKSLLSEVSKRDALATKLFPHIGVFDHSDKTLDEVASYGVEKLKITCPKGHEQTALDGFLLNRPLPGAAPENASFAQDSGNVSRIDTYLKKSA